MRRQITKFIGELDPVRKRRIQTKTRSLSGIIPSAKNNEEIWFESALERDFALILEDHPDVTHYQEQPITIEYYHSGKNRVYTPDFLVYFSDNSGMKPWLCEIKYRSELRDKFAKYKPKFKAAVQQCEKDSWDFKLFTEEYIRGPYLDNLKFLSRYNYNELDGACYELVIRTVSDLGHTSPKEFMLSIQDAHFNLRGRCLYALWYGIKIGDIACDTVGQKINMNSPIWLAEKLEFKSID